MAGSKLLNLLKGKKKILILTHRAADVDSVSSAAALYYTLNGKYFVSIGIPDHINLNSRHFCKQMKIPYKINPSDLTSFDALIFVDVRSLPMLGTLQNSVKEFDGLKIVIDHHSSSEQNIAPKKHSFIKPGYLSTAQVVNDLLINSNLKLNANAATSIAAGIIADAAGFEIGDSASFQTLGKALSKSKFSYTKIRSLLEAKIDLSEKVAQLKAAHRNKIFNSHNHLIVVTKVGFFEASSANYLVSGGADVAFAAGKDERGIILSARASSSFVEKFKFHLAQHVLKNLQKEFPGSSGGHSGAATYNSPSGNIDVLLQRCTELTHSFINSKSRTKKPLKQY